MELKKKLIKILIAKKIRYGRVKDPVVRDISLLAIKEMMRIVKASKSPLDAVNSYARRMNAKSMEGGSADYIYSISYDVAMDILDAFIGYM